MSFSPALLNNFFALKEYLRSEPEIEPEKVPPAKELYFGKWQVIWIRLKWPFEYLISSILSLIATLFYCLGATRLSNTITVLSKQVLRDQHHLDSQDRFGSRLLIPAYNVHQLGSCDIYQNDPLSVNEIKDPLVKDLTFFHQFQMQGVANLREKHHHHVHFYHPNGLCRGAVLFHQFLFLRAKGSPLERFLSASKHFVTGVPSRAALLMALEGTEEELLGYTNNYMEKQIIKGSDLEKSAPVIATLPPGFYSINLCNHRMDYLKLSDDEGYLWDDNHGAIDCSGPSHAKLVQEHISSYHIPSVDYSVIFQSVELEFAHF